MALFVGVSAVSGNGDSQLEPRQKILIFGASGAIGKQLVREVTSKHGAQSVIAVLRKTPLPQTLTHGDNGEELVTCEFGVDLRDQESVEHVVAKHASTITAVWNLAAPLSVETEADPQVAEDVTVGGFTRVITAMDKADLLGSTRLLFSDSIGSFGGAAPRTHAQASWLVHNPAQDPGSEYGRQKRRIRELMKASKYDTRWAVIPGVLHDDASWGDGTTEYALEALKSFSEALTTTTTTTTAAMRRRIARDDKTSGGGDGLDGSEDGAKEGGGHGHSRGKVAAAAAAAAGVLPRSVYKCPLPASSQLPMVWVSDLVLGLVALMDAPREHLREPEAGYTLAGFSFSPRDLELSLSRHHHSPPLSLSSPPLWRMECESGHDGGSNPAAAFAELWPDSISAVEALRDFGWRARKVPDLESAVALILAAHAERHLQRRHASNNHRDGASDGKEEL